MGKNRNDSPGKSRARESGQHGIDDDERFGHSSRAHQQQRFLAQVQAAVESALQIAATPELNLLSVREVTKERGALLVVLEPRDAGGTPDIVSATKAVVRASSMIRREVASAISRKETPKLRFIVLPIGAQKIDEEA